MEEKPPFLAEYAKSGRAGCKGCSGNIECYLHLIILYLGHPHFDSPT